VPTFSLREARGSLKTDLTKVLSNARFPGSFKHPDGSSVTLICSEGILESDLARLRPAFRQALGENCQVFDSLLSGMKKMDSRILLRIMGRIMRLILSIRQ
jgi:hypothetical protein